MKRLADRDAFALHAALGSTIFEIAKAFGLTPAQTFSRMGELHLQRDPGSRRGPRRCEIAARLGLPSTPATCPKHESIVAAAKALDPQRRRDFLTWLHETAG